MCCYLIWHPSTLPHNPIALKETEIVQPLLSVYPLPFFLRGPAPAGVRPSQCPNECPEMLCFIPTGVGTDLMRCETATVVHTCPFWNSLGIFLPSRDLFCRSRKETRIFLNLWLQPWYHLLWSDMIERVTSAILYLRLPYSCLRYNRQFSFPISVQGKPLLRSNPVNAKIWLRGVAYSTKAICVWVCVCVLWYRA